jgi:hypothetical protein
VRLKRKGNVIENVIENAIENAIENGISNVIENGIENALKPVALLTSLKTARFFIENLRINNEKKLYLIFFKHAQQQH